MDGRATELLNRIKEGQRVREALSDTGAWILEEGDESPDPEETSAPVKH